MLDQGDIKGDPARLFPVLAETSKEGRSLSVLLSCLISVREFGQIMMASIGQRVGSAAKMEAYSEVRLPKNADTNCRPDGLIVLRVGKRVWTALIEAKVGNAEIQVEQIERYLQLAKLNSIDAVITISNQFAASPIHPPYNVSKLLLRGVDLYHWSWMRLRTEASILCDKLAVEDQDQLYILSELVRFLDHPSAGVSSFDQMNSEWSDLVALFQKGGRLNRRAEQIVRTVEFWEQEVRDLCLILARRTNSNVRLKLTRSERNNPEQRFTAECENLADRGCLTASFDVPDAAAPIDVCVDLSKRTIQAGMKLKAPQDRKSGAARLNWLLRQLKSVDPEELSVRLHWPGAGPHTQAPLAVVREDASPVLHDDRNRSPSSIEVLLTVDDGRRFRGPRTFIQLLEQAVPDFYHRVGQHLSAWQPAAPPIKEERPKETVLQDVPLGEVEHEVGEWEESQAERRFFPTWLGR